MMSRQKPALHALWSGISTGISLLVVALALLIVGVPAAVGGIPLTVLSGSMRPTYQPGDLVVIKPKDPQEIRIGEVITFQVKSGESELITHRVIERQSATDGTVSFVTQGDANNAPDENAIRDVQIHGTVWYRIPMLGWVNNLINGETRRWLIPTVAGILGLYALWNFGAALYQRSRRGQSTQVGTHTGTSHS